MIPMMSIDEHHCLERRSVVPNGLVAVAKRAILSDNKECEGQ
jgi:hypothetical protein